MNGAQYIVLWTERQAWACVDRDQGRGIISILQRGLFIALRTGPEPVSTSVIDSSTRSPSLDAAIGRVASQDNATGRDGSRGRMTTLCRQPGLSLPTSLRETHVAAVKVLCISVTYAIGKWQLLPTRGFVRSSKTE